MLGPMGARTPVERIARRIHDDRARGEVQRGPVAQAVNLGLILFLSLLVPFAVMLLPGI